MSRSKEAFLALPHRPVSKPEARYCATCGTLLGDDDGWNFCAPHLEAAMRERTPDVVDDEAAA